MRAVIQRVSQAQVVVEGETTGAIESGLLILLGIGQDETEQDRDWMIKKILNLRIFNDPEGRMNLSILDTGGDLLVVSQFTLYADCKKGNRPSYIRSAPPTISIPVYEDFLETLRARFDGRVAVGRFGAHMEVSLLNDGPVTIILDSRQPDF